QGVALAWAVEGDEAGVVAGLGQDFVGHGRALPAQKRSFNARTAAKRATGSSGGRPGTRARTVAASSALAGRRKGLVAFSSGMVLGTVGFRARRSAWSAAIFAARGALLGSRVRANCRFFSVYS